VIMRPDLILIDIKNISFPETNSSNCPHHSVYFVVRSYNICGTKIWEGKNMVPCVPHFFLVPKGIFWSHETYHIFSASQRTTIFKFWQFFFSETVTYVRKVPQFLSFHNFFYKKIVTVYCIDFCLTMSIFVLKQKLSKFLWHWRTTFFQLCK
jgi:hypothetical protein